jgi:hypothetical protein
MGYYDKYDDSNRAAHKRGERDAEWGYRSHQYDYSLGTEIRNAYEDGYEEERRRLARIADENRQEALAQERARQHRIAEQLRYEEQRYHEEEELRRMEAEGEMGETK